jgi:predicted PurR-regulated permease PerM
MSRPFLTFFAINTITTVFITTIYNFYIQFTYLSNKDTVKYDYILNKIKELESNVKKLQNSIEELEENNNIKNNSIIESNIALTSKLEDFINYSYDVYDESE